MGVVEQLHDLLLSVNFLQVWGVQPGLVNDFNGHLEKQKRTLNTRKIQRSRSKLEKNEIKCKSSRASRRRGTDLCFGDLMFGQFHHCEVSFPQCADDLIEADLQGPSLGSSGLSPLAALCHDHHGAATVRSYSVGIDKSWYLWTQTQLHISELGNFISIIDHVCRHKWWPVDL